MSTDNAKPGHAVENPEPERSVTLPGFSEIIVTAFNFDAQDLFYFDYLGWPEDLVAAGVMLGPWALPTGKHPRDPDGGKVCITRQWHLDDEDLLRPYCRVERRRTLVELRRWPGASEALDAHQKWEAWDKARRPNFYPPELVPMLSPRPKLRLVVDNTR